MMAIAVEIELSAELGRLDYDFVLDGLALDEHPPDGLRAHVCTESDGRIRILEVWDSLRQYREYREQRLIPNIEFALGPARAAIAAESIRRTAPVRGLVIPGPREQLAEAA